MIAKTLTLPSSSRGSRAVSARPVVRQKTITATTLHRSTHKATKFKFSKFLPSAGSLSILFLFGFLGLLGYHLVSANSAVAKGFQLKKLHLSIEQLTDQNKRLIVQQAEAGSISKVQETALSRGLVQTQNEEYLNLLHFTQR